MCIFHIPHVDLEQLSSTTVFGKKEYIVHLSVFYGMFYELLTLCLFLEWWFFSCWFNVTNPQASSFDSTPMAITWTTYADNVDSLSLVGYQFSNWFSLLQVNHEVKVSTNIIFSIGFVYKDWQNHKIKYLQIWKFSAIDENWYTLK